MKYEQIEVSVIAAPGAYLESILRRDWRSFFQVIIGLRKLVDIKSPSDKTVEALPYAPLPTVYGRNLDGTHGR